MQPLIFDCEATGAQRNKGNPFDPRNRLCCISFSFRGDRRVRDIEYSDGPYKHYLDDFQELLDEADLVVGFNLKYDIHWGRRYGLDFSKVKVWDCQLYHFLQSNQRVKLPSMDMVAAHWGVPQKLNVVRTEYWDKGLDTDEVPWDILSEYALHDVDPVNSQIFEKQYKEFLTLPDIRRKLILLHMRDLLVLEEMEFNGALYNKELSIKIGLQLERDIATIDAALSRYCVGIPISFNSDEQLSLFLYGGTLFHKVREKYLFEYKDPRKAPVEKERWIVKEIKVPRIFEPRAEWKKQKEGIYSTDKTTLQKLRFTAKGFQLEIIDLLIKRSALEQQKSTYAYGTPKLMDKMGWENNILHGQLNQNIVVTGRLSSSKPNLQNQQEAMQVCFESRFKWKR